MTESADSNTFQPNPCQFCGQDPTYSPIEEMERHGVKVYFCHKCSAEYTYWSDGGTASKSLYITHRGKMYRWTRSACGTAQLWYIKNPGTPGTRKNEDLEFIKAFTQDVPNITPDNFLDKLSIYLLFL